ncbi:MAG: toxic anion resistance protein [Pseudomonadota bacterium]
MSDEIATKAAQSAPLIEEANAIVLEEPTEGVTALSDAPPPLAAEIEERISQIDMEDTNSIVSFGTKAQTGLHEISQKMLADVKNKDVGAAGSSLREIVTTLRGFSVDELDMRTERSWWEKLLGRVAPAAKFVARFEEVQGQIDGITNSLLTHEHTLLKDIKSLDILYERTLEFFHELALYIAAGDAKVARLDEVEIPALEAALNAASEDDKTLVAQSVRDLRTARDDLERRVHDLRLTRQVTMQSLPSIRLVQENDKALVTKINSTLVNTVPLWETQLAQSLTIQRSAEAAGDLKAASDLTNDLLQANAQNLRQANAKIRQEMERGVFDIEAVRAANENLVGTIEDSLRIADEGKARRAATERELEKLEAELRQTLAAASAAQSASQTEEGTTIP